MMKKLFFACTLLFACTAFAQDSMDQWIKMLKEDLKAQKKDIVTQEMKTFTPEEAKRFWPIYDAYNTELEKFVDARLAVMKAYIDDYDTLTDAQATELLNRRFNIQKQRNALDDKYRKQFETALSPKRLVRFYQIEHQLQLLIELQATSAVPLAKWW
jgi:hypothetical protein